MIFIVKDWVILLRASLCSSIDLGRLRACLPARSGTFEAKYWVTPSQPQYQHGSPVLAWHRHLFLCCFGRCFATITLSCQVVTPSQSHYHHGSPVSAAWQRASPPSLLAKLEQRPWQLTMGSLRASLSSQAAIFKVMYRVQSMRANTVFFFQAHGVLFPTTQQSLLLENAIPFSLWLLSLCFFKTHGAADKNKTILRYK